MAEGQDDEMIESVTAAAEEQDTVDEMIESVAAADEERLMEGWNR